tara:strand:+ start:1838 stop:2137 length:300 start_codon:yes stop_codon:yes gene_type:complete
MNNLSNFIFTSLSRHGTLAVKVGELTMFLSLDANSSTEKASNVSVYSESGDLVAQKHNVTDLADVMKTLQAMESLKECMHQQKPAAKAGLTDVFKEWES